MRVGGLVGWRSIFRFSSPRRRYQAYPELPIRDQLAARPHWARSLPVVEVAPQSGQPRSRGSSGWRGASSRVRQSLRASRSAFSRLYMRQVGARCAERLPIDVLAFHPRVTRLRECRMADAGLEGVRIFPDRLVSYLVVQPGASEFHEEAHVVRYPGIEFDVSQLPELLHRQAVWGNPVLRMIQARAHQRVHPNEIYWTRMRLKLLSQQCVCVGGWYWIAKHHPRFKRCSVRRVVEDACRQFHQIVCET